jgi:hypothetical protein
MAETTSDTTATDNNTMRQGASGGMGDAMATARDSVKGMPSTVGQAASEGASATTATMQQLKTTLEDATQRMTSVPLSARLTWRLGRWLGRVEGVLWLSSKGLGIWWARTKKNLAHRSGNQWTRTAAQWGPSIVAVTWMGAQLINRARHSAAGKK